MARKQLSGQNQNNTPITNLPLPNAGGDAANKTYADSISFKDNADITWLTSNASFDSNQRYFVQPTDKMIVVTALVDSYNIIFPANAAQQYQKVRVFYAPVGGSSVGFTLNLRGFADTNYNGGNYVYESLKPRESIDAVGDNLGFTGTGQMWRFFDKLVDWQSTINQSSNDTRAVAKQLFPFYIAQDYEMPYDVPVDTIRAVMIDGTVTSPVVVLPYMLEKEYSTDGYTIIVRATEYPVEIRQAQDSAGNSANIETIPANTQALYVYSESNFNWYGMLKGGSSGGGGSSLTPDPDDSIKIADNKIRVNTEDLAPMNGDPGGGQGSLLVNNNGHLTGIVPYYDPSDNGGAINMSGRRIVMLPDPQSAEEPVTKYYSDTTYLPKSGGTVDGSFDMQGNRIENLQDTPSAPNDATTKTYVDNTAIVMAIALG